MLNISRHVKCDKENIAMPGRILNTASRSSLVSTISSKERPKLSTTNSRSITDFPKQSESSADNKKSKATRDHVTLRPNDVVNNIKNVESCEGRRSSSDVIDEEKREDLTLQDDSSCSNDIECIEVDNVNEKKESDCSNVAVPIARRVKKPSKTVLVARPPWNANWNGNKHTENNQISDIRNRYSRINKLSFGRSKTHCNVTPTSNVTNKRNDAPVATESCNAISKSVSDVHERGSKVPFCSSPSYASVNKYSTPNHISDDLNSSTSLQRKCTETSIQNSPNNRNATSSCSSVRSNLANRNQTSLSKLTALFNQKQSNLSQERLYNKSEHVVDKKPSGCASKSSVTSLGSSSKSLIGSEVRKVLRSIPAFDADSASKIERLSRGLSSVMTKCDRKSSNSKTLLNIREDKENVVNNPLKPKHSSGGTNTSIEHKNVAVSMQNTPRVTKIEDPKVESPLTLLRLKFEKTNKERINNRTSVNKQQSNISQETLDYESKQVADSPSSCSLKASVVSVDSCRPSSKASDVCKVVHSDISTVVRSHPTQYLESLSKLDRLTRGLSTVIRASDRKKFVNTTKNNISVTNVYNNKGQELEKSISRYSKVTETEQPGSRTSLQSIEINHTSDVKGENRMSLHTLPILANLRHDEKTSPQDRVPLSKPVALFKPTSSGCGMKSTRAKSSASKVSEVLTVDKNNSVLSYSALFQMQLNGKNDPKSDSIGKMHKSVSASQDGQEKSVNRLKMKRCDAAKHVKSMKKYNNICSRYFPDSISKKN